MNLRELCKQKGTNIKRLSEQLNVAPSTLYSISSGETSLGNVGISLFVNIAKALDCSSDELLSILQGVDNSEAQQLTAEEQELLDIMRTAAPEGQKQLLIFARGIAQSYPK